MQESKLQYKLVIFSAEHAQDFAAQIEKLLNAGWQMASPMSTFVADGQAFFCQPMILPAVAPPEPQVQEPQRVNHDAEVNAILETIPKYTKDLLDVNKIALICQDNRLFISSNGEKQDGFSTFSILNIIKTSDHCPHDLDENRVVDQLEATFKKIAEVFSEEEKK